MFVAGIDAHATYSVLAHAKRLRRTGLCPSIEPTR